jgi:hypothetical protein
MVIRERMSFVPTAKGSYLMMYKERYGCSASLARTGAMRNVQGQRRIHSYAITACRTKKI